VKAMAIKSPAGYDLVFGDVGIDVTITNGKGHISKKKILRGSKEGIRIRDDARKPRLCGYRCRFAEWLGYRFAQRFLKTGQRVFFIQSKNNELDYLHESIRCSFSGGFEEAITKNFTDFNFLVSGGDGGKFININRKGTNESSFRGIVLYYTDGLSKEQSSAIFRLFKSMDGW